VILSHGDDYKKLVRTFET